MENILKLKEDLTDYLAVNNDDKFLSVLTKVALKSVMILFALASFIFGIYLVASSWIVAANVLYTLTGLTIFFLLSNDCEGIAYLAGMIGLSYIFGNLISLICQIHHFSMWSLIVSVAMLIFGLILFITGIKLEEG